MCSDYNGLIEPGVVVVAVEFYKFWLKAIYYHYRLLTSFINLFCKSNVMYIQAGTICMRLLLSWCSGTICMRLLLSWCYLYSCQLLTDIANAVK